MCCMIARSCLLGRGQSPNQGRWYCSFWWKEVSAGRLSDVLAPGSWLDCSQSYVEYVIGTWNGRVLNSRKITLSASMKQDKSKSNLSIKEMINIIESQFLCWNRKNSLEKKWLSYHAKSAWKSSLFETASWKTPRKISKTSSSRYLSNETA